LNHKRFLLICGDYRILFVNCSLQYGQGLPVQPGTPCPYLNGSQKTGELIITYNTKLK
jgi:hypothetical protein